MYVCMCVCMYVCMYVYMCVCVCGSSDRSLMVDPLNCFPFQSVLYNWFNKKGGRKKGRKFNDALITFLFTVI